MEKPVFIILYWETEASIRSNVVRNATYTTLFGMVPLICEKYIILRVTPTKIDVIDQGSNKME